MSAKPLLTVLCVGVALGFAARIVDGFAPRWVGDVAAVWVLAGFWAGTQAKIARGGAVLGTLCLVAGCLSYYFWRVWIDGDIWAEFLLSVGLFWLIASVLVGATAGYLGSRSRRDAHLWSVVAGAFFGEALAIWFLRRGLLQVTTEVVIGLIFLIPGRLQMRRTLVFAGAVTLAVLLIGTGYRLALGARREARQANEPGSVGAPPLVRGTVERMQPSSAVR